MPEENVKTESGIEVPATLAAPEETVGEEIATTSTDESKEVDTALETPTEEQVA